MQNTNDIFSISHLRIRNFHGVIFFDRDLSSSTNAVVGVNGAGKSTILHAIDILFSWFSARIRNAKGNGISIKDEDITMGETECELEVTLSNGVSWTLYKQRSKSRKKPTGKTKLTDMMDYINRLLIDNEDNPEEEFLPLYSFYSVNRVVDVMPGKLRKDGALCCGDVYDRELNKQLNYRSFFRWFNERESIEDKEYRYNSFFEPDKQLSTVRSAIMSILPGYSNLHVKNNPRTFVIEKEGEEFMFDQLSDGEKSLIALVGDIARKLAMSHPYSQNPLMESGIILIDEIDLHLHPSWQRDVLPRMREAFKGCQFIISTHSPFVITNISNQNKDFLFLMRDGKEELYCNNIYGREVSKIISEVLEMPTLRNTEVQEHLSKVWECLKMGDSESCDFVNAYNWLQQHLDRSDIVFMDIAVQQRINKKGSRS